MNILLVYPKYPDTFWSFKHVLKFVSKKAAFPPLGLLTVASMLPKGWNKKLIDLNVSELKRSDIIKADLVLISAMIVQKNSVNDIVALCKRYNKKIVAGGPLFTTGHKQFNDIDHFVLDEAEMTLPKFLDDLRLDNPKRVYRSNIKPDITKTPIPMWSLIDLNNYNTMLIQYSRGCPYNCEFCDIIVMNGRVPRTKTPSQMLNEFQSLYNAGWRGVLFIVDDNLIGNKIKLKDMLKHIILWQKAHKFPFKLLSEASVNLADDKELMRLMSKANFNKIFLGIETINKDSLKECDKVQNVNRDLKQAVEIIQSYGMQVMGGFIVGFDNDDETIFSSQIKFIQQTGIVNAMVGMLTALPKTRLWNRLNVEGRLVNDATGENTDGKLNFIPKMDKNKLIDGYKMILSTIYSRKNYYRRINIFLRNYKPTVKSKLTRTDILAFIRSIWKIGFLSKSRFLYWDLLIKTTFTKIKALPIAIEMAILGQHFEKITRKINSKPKFKQQKSLYKPVFLNP